jgi:acyl carrier protein
MTDDEILAGIAEVARRHLDLSGELDRGSRLVEDLELDSIKGLTLAMEVENRFRVCLDPEAEAEMVTVGDLVAAVRRQLEQPLGS